LTGGPSASDASIGDRYAGYPTWYIPYLSDVPKPTTAKPFGTEDATVASASNGGKGFANSQASKLANQNPFVRFNAQGTGNGFGFGK
jgi:hypothetical protein